jgi:hypothetical protein
VETNEEYKAMIAGVEGANEIYAVMQRWKDAFVAGDSLTEPGTTAWTVGAAEEIEAQVVVGFEVVVLDVFSR